MEIWSPIYIYVCVLRTLLILTCLSSDWRFIEKLQQDIPGEGVKQQLVVLCSIYALFLLHKHQGDFLATGYITSKQGLFANEQLRALYTQVCLIGFVICVCCSFVYPKLYEAAWKDPLNESDIPDGFHEYIRPLLEQQLQTARLWMKNCRKWEKA